MRTRRELKRDIREFFKRDQELTDETERVEAELDTNIEALLNALLKTEKLFSVQKEKKSLQYYFVEYDLECARKHNRELMGRPLFALLKMWAES